jgi:hypothetical protein
MVHELYWILPLCVLLGVLFRRQLGTICLLFLLAIYFGGKHFWKVLAAPFVLLWYIVAFPIRFIWRFDGYDDVGYSMRAQYRRDSSIFCARLLMTGIAQALYIYGGIRLYELILHK